jgi:predicted nucleic acid-binding protein
LEPVPVDASLAVAAGRLRARHYHRVRRAVSMADCITAAAARNLAQPLAAADPQLLDLCHHEGIETVVLPGTDGSVWTAR